MATVPFSAAEAAPETFYVACDDGWLVAVHRYAPRRPSGRLPVLMVHGIAANRHHFDLSARYSLARYSASRGFDTYVLELRGAGLARPPSLRAHRAGYGFADYAERDVPAAVLEILRRTGAERLHGIGHSMGGMLLFCVATAAQVPLASITSIGTPLVGELDLGLGVRERRLLQVASRLSPAAAFTPPAQRRVPLRRLLTTAGWMMPLSNRLADNLLYNVANMDPEVSKELARVGIQDIPLQLINEITQTIRGQLGPYAYESRLEYVAAPVFAISGSVDRIAPPTTVSAAVALVRGADVRYREMGTRFGDRIDYGHVDLLLGVHAPDEVYPQVMDFVEDVDAS